MSPHDEWLRNASLIRHLHEMMDRTASWKMNQENGEEMTVNPMEIQQIMDYLRIATRCS